MQKRLVCMGSLPFKADDLGDENTIYKQRLEGDEGGQPPRLWWKSGQEEEIQETDMAGIEES